jgi:hypothetical protein
MPKGGEAMRVSGSQRWCCLTHKAGRLCAQREETPHQPPAPSEGGSANAPAAPSRKRRRHRWGDPQRFFHPTRPDISKTERACIHDGCTIVRVTRHEGAEHWVEFYKDGERIEGDLTPPCVPD